MSFDVTDLENWMSFWDPSAPHYLVPTNEPERLQAEQTSQVAQPIILAATTPVATTCTRKIKANQKAPDDKKKVRQEQSRISSKIYRARQKAKREQLETVNAHLENRVLLLEAEIERLKRQLARKNEAEVA